MQALVPPGAAGQRLRKVQSEGAQVLPCLLQLPGLLFQLTPKQPTLRSTLPPTCHIQQNHVFLASHRRRHGKRRRGRRSRCPPAAAVLTTAAAAAAR